MKDKLRELAEMVREAYRAGFIAACKWPSPATQDIDSPAYTREFNDWSFSVREKHAAILDAERIEADERAVPAAEIEHFVDRVSEMRMMPEAILLGIGKHKLFAHPPAQAAQSETVRPWPKFVQDECLEVLRNMDTELSATGRKSARIERMINAISGMPASDSFTHHHSPDAADSGRVTDASAEDRFEQYVKTLIDHAPDVQKLGERLAHLLDDDQFNNIEPTLIGIAAALAAQGQSAASLVGVPDGIAIIAAERKRQIDKEGWSPAHDVAEYEGGELASAAACYAMPPEYKLRECTPPLAWPWEESWWKPGDRLRELAKAGALIAAEIDRLAAAPSQPEE